MTKNAVKGVKGFVSRPALERFREKYTILGNDCWQWNGSKRNGYGLFFFGGENVKAHRFSWEAEHGRSFPPGLEACHSCDNKWCVNPSHIWPGTHRENMIDARRKGLISMSNPDAIGAFNRAKTHCVRGHEFSDQNTKISFRGKQRMRSCRACIKHRDSVRDYKAERARRALEGK